MKTTHILGNDKTQSAEIISLVYSHMVFSCAGQLYRWPFLSLSEWISESVTFFISTSSGHCRAVVNMWQRQSQRQRQRQTEGFSNLVAKLSDKLRNSTMTSTVSDWQSESDLDSIRDSCDVLSVFFIVVVSCRQDIFISQCWKVFKWPICCAV